MEVLDNPTPPQKQQIATEERETIMVDTRQPRCQSSHNTLRKLGLSASRDGEGKTQRGERTVVIMRRGNLWLYHSVRTVKITRDPYPIIHHTLFLIPPSLAPPPLPPPPFPLSLSILVLGQSSTLARQALPLWALTCASYIATN